MQRGKNCAVSGLFTTSHGSLPRVGINPSLQALGRWTVGERRAYNFEFLLLYIDIAASAPMQVLKQQCMRTPDSQLAKYRIHRHIGFLYAILTELLS